MDWVGFYNFKRPNQFLKMRTPNEAYVNFKLATRVVQILVGHYSFSSEGFDTQYWVTNLNGNKWEYDHSAPLYDLIFNQTLSDI